MPVRFPKAWLVFPAVLVIPAALVALLPDLAAAQAAGRVLVAGGTAEAGDVLPPESPWSGKSRALLLDAKAPWATPFEASGYVATPRYEETVAWLRRLAEAAPEVEMVSLGKSPEGRDLWLVIASASGARTPEALQEAGKPVLLAQAGIHAGEIDGKDAGMMLLRDLTVGGTRRELLRDASFLFLPILNVDGHERFTAAGRINQRGPVECGWRTTSANLNLNRDYGKLDTPEMRHLIAALNAWEPDLYLDIHVSDGFDHQYDVTWTYNGPHAWSPNIAAWLDAELSPALTADLRAMGHVPGPYVTALTGDDSTQGIRIFTSGPRFSEGYGDARHRATVLVETHSLKPYVQRVLGTYVLLESALGTLGRHGRELEQATAADRKLRRREVVLDFIDAEPESGRVEYLGIRSRLTPSAVSGGLRQEWTGEPVTLRVPLVIEAKAGDTVSRPRAYWIPAAWTEVIERLLLHGIRVERQEEAREVPVTAYRIEQPLLQDKPYEGHARVTGKPVAEKRVERYSAGSVRVPTDQPLGDLAVLLLEPGSPDSFFQWGFFLSVLQEGEYSEAYVMEPLAAEMLAQSPTLAAEFREKLATDAAFAGNPRARLDWFYRKTPYADERWRLYPVGREE